MVDRVASDHPSVRTVRGTVESSGATDRPRLRIPAAEADAFPGDEVVRLIVDGETYHARFESGFEDDDRLVRGAYDSPRLARNPGEGANRLVEWFESSRRSLGETVLLDVVSEGFAYGLREPGTRVVYDATEPPDEGLASIAEDVEDES